MEQVNTTAKISNNNIRFIEGSYNGGRLKNELTGIKSKISTQKNGITGVHTKAIVLKDQSCCPYIFGLKASDYIIDSGNDY
ncbi:MAG: hypothetical protein EZS28_002942 [Streblomastix strix]|uniref:Uncharacterized protein n=1 Tax=Streblomastix strix TaxID=222440 RepID=A0A5J4X426_9EUKA|nr:MAG: hypothetical protein EZS28_002942 [Streblomastix strix]